MSHRNYRHYNSFGVIDTAEIRAECKKSHVQFESMRYFVPFVVVVWYNDKGRIALAVQRESPVREPREHEWGTKPVDENEMLQYIGHNGSCQTTNIFYRAQSGHSGIKQHQRPGYPYDFRHNILMRKTTTENWNRMKHRDDRYLRAETRDVHLVPVQFLYHDPVMLRDYGDRILMFNMNREETWEAFRTACETDNGYILVSEHIALEHLECVYALEKNSWEMPYNPVTDPRFCDEQGVTDAHLLCQYYSRVYASGRRSIRFEDLEPMLRWAVTLAGQHYEQHLRHAGDTPAQTKKTEADKEIVIDDVVQEIGEAFTKEKKNKIEAKQMPAGKKDPPGLPLNIAKKTKLPPPCAREPVKKEAVEKSAGKPPPAHLANLASTDATVKSETTDKTVKNEPKPPDVPPPPKRTTETTVQDSSKKIKIEGKSGLPTPPARPVQQSSSNKMSCATSATPTPPQPPTRTPTPPDHPPPTTPRVPAPPSHPPRKPGEHSRWPHPTPPAPPRRSSDATDTRTPLPRQRQEEQEEVERPSFNLEYDSRCDMDTYIH